MSNNMNKKQSSRLTVGFILLFPGIYLATTMSDNRALQVVGLILIIASSAVFGSLINSRPDRKK